MATRRDAREWAVQMLFTLDLNPGHRDRLFSDFWPDHPHDQKAQAFAEGLVEGVQENLKEIDEAIRRCAQHWDIRRMAVVDRNVLRMAVFEILYLDDVPPVVSINEAVDLAKYFNSPESGRFVNGILDRVKRNREAEGAATK